MDETRRLWRLRKLHHSIDAEVRAGKDRCELRFLYDGEVACDRRCDTLASALAEAARTRAELERAGWNWHW
jgi:hypothetical protein